MKTTLSAAFLLLFTMVGVFLGGLYFGILFTRQQDTKDFKEEKSNLELRYIDMALNSYLRGIGHGVLLSNRFHWVGVADWCNVNLKEKEIQCNYEDKDSCTAYLQENEICVSNILNYDNILK